ncbi:tyrosine-type recombinase/integrase [Gordonia sp. HY442]|nr:tyrosine-type recombinase/integrase [Gordonia zhenghanii]
MVSLAAFAGLRRGEIATTRGDQLADDYDGPVLRVLGKGGRTRLVPLDAGIAAQIAARGQGWTFPGQIDGHLSPAHVGKIVSRLMPGDWTAHTLRHRFASAAYSDARDIRAVQELLGHASVRTTQIYTAVPDGARRAAVAAAAAGYNLQAAG